jgi:hypothetical protein
MRQRHLVVIGRIGVAQTCQKVCDRIRHRHRALLLFIAALCIVNSAVMTAVSPSSQWFPAGEISQWACCAPVL